MRMAFDQCGQVVGSPSDCGRTDRSNVKARCKRFIDIRVATAGYGSVTFGFREGTLGLLMEQDDDREHQEPEYLALIPWPSCGPGDSAPWAVVGPNRVGQTKVLRKRTLTYLPGMYLLRSPRWCRNRRKMSCFSPVACWAQNGQPRNGARITLSGCHRATQMRRCPPNLTGRSPS